jgi:hypothetical protein
VTARATIDDLYRVPEHGKAEIVDGELVLMSPTGGLPGLAAGAIYASLREHARVHGGGRAYPDNVGFIVNLPRRRSFSPDASLHPSITPTMKFLEGAPADVVRVHRGGEPQPTVYRRGEVAAAEPAVPGWRMPVDELFE